jgi:hypothetical protein
MVRAITARCRRSDLGGCADAPTIIWSLRVQQGWLAGHEAHPEADGESVRRIRDDRALLKEPRPSASQRSATERFLNDVVYSLSVRPRESGLSV